MLCVGRHDFLSGHFRQYFEDLGVIAIPAVGLDDAIATARAVHPDVVVWEYDLLVATPLARWEAEPDLARLPVVAVSLTRRPEEPSATDVNGIGGLLYLPALAPAVVLATLQAAAAAAATAATAATTAQQRAPTLSWPAMERGFQSVQ